MRPRLVPLAEQDYEEFWSLFRATMPDDEDRVVAALGLTRERYERLPREVGELRRISDGGETAGYAWFEVRARTLHIHALLLRPAHRGRGLGGRVLRLLIETHRDDVDSVELGVEPGNVAARTLYEHAGFEYAGERLGFLIMRRSLRTTEQSRQLESGPSTSSRA